MAFDYTSIAATALELVTEFGREVTLVEMGETPLDAALPWNGSTATVKRSLTVNACFVEPQSLNTLGTEQLGADFLRRFRQIAIVASEETLSEFDKLIEDDGAESKIEYISSLRPGPITILHYMGVLR